MRPHSVGLQLASEPQADKDSDRHIDTETKTERERHTDTHTHTQTQSLPLDSSYEPHNSSDCAGDSRHESEPRQALCPIWSRHVWCTPAQQASLLCRSSVSHSVQSPLVLLIRGRRWRRACEPSPATLCARASGRAGALYARVRTALTRACVHTERLDTC